MAAPAPATLATFKDELARLVAHFSSQQPYFTGPDYNEAKLREDFLNPFFAALGWDVGNRKGLIHTEREVDIEVRTEISGKQKRADYVFRIARLERFTCEAKKPAETLHNGHAYQAKRDAYARGIPFAVLSDFEETRFYVVGSRPHRSEAVTVGQWKHLHFTQYLDSAAELWDLLAYENITTGSLDRLIDALPKRATRLKSRQGYLIRPDRTKSLDAEFLNFLDDARQRLGSDLLKHNDRDDLLTGNRLNEAAQRILDRLVFLRICEDRGIDTGTLLSTQLRDWYHHQDERPRLKRGAFDSQKRQKNLLPDSVAEEPPSPRYAPPAEGGLYRVFVAHVRALDQRPPSYQPFFNGQLFKPHFSEELVVGDEWLANFIDDLTADDEGYNFADIKVEILGDAYERFLGKILRPQGRGTTIEEKPEVRKAGGVYYTPRYIVDYIVEQTVGRQLAGKTPAQVAKLRFLDPACGSGSFLIRVYERVMEHHLRHFTERVREFRERSALDDTPLEKLLRPHRDDYYLDAAGNVRLTTRLKRQILQNNVYGVDIDAQAVEVTQLSLYLKMLEGENRESLHHQAKDLFNKEALLPPLDQNIKCGNSLIGSDFSLDPAELVRVNAFDWDIGFEKIMASGGFDAVVGNPPYVLVENGPDKKYLRAHYKSDEGKPDLYKYFIELGHKVARRDGRFGMIMPNSVLLTPAYAKCREFVVNNATVDTVVVFAGSVFDEASVNCVIPLTTKTDKRLQTSNVRLVKDTASRPTKDSLATALKASCLIDATGWNEGPFCFAFPEHAESSWVKKMKESGVSLGSLGRYMLGMQVYHNTLHTKEEMENRIYHSPTPKSNGWYPESGGRNIKRYELSETFKEWVLPGEHSYTNFDLSLAKGERLVVREITGETLVAALTDSRHIPNKAVIVFRPSELNPRYILGILNSRLLGRYVSATTEKGTQKLFPRISLKSFRELPIRVGSSDDKAWKESYAELCQRVEKIIRLTATSTSTRSDTERAALDNAIRKTDRDIDQLVYQLYGLTPEEIALVEGTAETVSIGAEA